METLVVVADEFHNRSHSSNPGAFGSYPSRNFREINCRTFQSGAGMIPWPLNDCSSPVTRRPFSSSPKTPSPTPPVVKKHGHSEQNPRHTKKISKSSFVSIPINVKRVDYSVKDDIGRSLYDNFYSELWAGPAYSNSPPPSSLPIPKFSIKPKRTVSLDLPSVSASDIDLLTPIAKSAPPSPTRDNHKSSRKDFFNGEDDSATKTLRRILNLDMADE